MRILYAGSPEISLPVLDALAQKNDVWELAGALTNPDAPQGRRSVVTPTAVGKAAEALGIGLLKPETLNAKAREEAASLRADLLVSFAYGGIFGPKFLDLFPLGGINIHPSLLPKFRGPSPIQAAILKGERETGISVQRIAAEVDAGDILAQERIALNGDETSESLGETFSRLAVPLLERTLQGLHRGEIVYLPQDHAQATYCDRISKEAGLIIWEDSAWEIDARIRAYTPWPLSLTYSGGKELYILSGKPLAGEDLQGAIPREANPGQVLGVDKNRGILIQTGEGIFAASRLQYSAKKALDFRDFLNGAPLFIGSRLTGRQDGEI